MIFIVIITIVFNFLHAYSISRRTSSTTFTLAFAILTASGTVAARKCQDIIVPIHIQALQPTYDIPIPQNNLDVVDFILNLTQQSSRFTVTAQTGHHTTSGCYNISAKFCQSDYGSQFPTVQVLTHGIGFDKSYWDLPYDAYHYSYINYALNRGYSTLSYDRLGIGGSSHGEPLNEIQSFLEVEALKSLTEKLRSGSLLDVLHSEQVPKIVHVGHSFGSALTYALANLYPQLTDAIVLTGFSMNSSFIDVFTAGGNFALANKNQPFRFGDLNSQQALQTYLEPVADYLAPAVDFSSLSPSQNLPNGYLITSNAESNKYQFLKPKYFDPRFLIELERTKREFVH